MFAPLDDLERNASGQPASVAIATPRREYTFRQVQDAALAVSARLHAAGVTAGSLVALDLPSALEWIVDLALFRLGVRTVSIRGVSDPGALPTGLLICEAGRRGIRGGALFEIDEHWIDSAVEAGLEGPPVVDFPGPDYDFRYILTSGTTGVPRAAAYSVSAFDHRMADGHLHWTDGRPELTLIGLSTTGGFHAAAACLRLGVPYLAVDRIDIEALEFAARQRIRVLCGSPAQVGAALAIGVALPELEEVRLSGATPSEALLGLIDVPVRSVYGSTEGGGVTQAFLGPQSDPYAVGVAVAGVELQVVDTAGIPTTGDGHVRYRSPGMVSGYLVNGSVVPFTDGWFVPGDRGTLNPDGSLVLSGRHSELFNLGGVKLDPAVVDRLAQAYSGVLDAAAFHVERQAGVPEVGLAVVATPDCDLRGLDQELRARLPTTHPTAFWQVQAIPRSRLGKPLRVNLAADFESNRAR
ncbi:MAG: hypothetical protein JWO10_463 [Microbacteriaceae bacterium]|nr:hypothetical protein [Microbacteriaceae bacterium]